MTAEKDEEKGRVAVAGLWEINWNTPLEESWCWTFVLREFCVKNWFMSPITGIKHNESRRIIDLQEFNDLKDVMELNEDLTRVFIDEKGDTLLHDFEHPKDAIYIFGNAGRRPIAEHWREGSHSVRIPTIQNSGVLWPHQCLLTVLHDRLVKTWAS